MKEIIITEGSDIAITSNVVSKEAFDEVKDDIKAIIRGYYEYRSKHI